MPRHDDNEHDLLADHIHNLLADHNHNLLADHNHDDGSDSLDSTTRSSAARRRSTELASDSRMRWEKKDV